MVTAVLLLVQVAWTEGPPLPDAQGFGGSFAGRHRDVLLVAGGSNFPDPDGPKAWSDKVFALVDGAWKDAGRLPVPMGYGAAVETDDGVLCVGGATSDRHLASVLLLRWERGALEIREMPPLPRPIGYLSGARAGGTVYVAGGRETLDGPALSAFLAFDTSWRELETWPGPARMLAVAGALDGAFYLFSGTALVDGRRDYLKDAYRFDGRWRRIADLPRSAVAAPSPAPRLGPGHLLVVGGDAGTGPDFPRDVLAYHALTDAWSRRGEAPFALVTTSAAGLTIPGGEVRPKVRSPQVWIGRPERSTPSFGGWNYATLLVYPLVMLLTAWAAGRARSAEDYFTGGGRVPWWAAGLSIYATTLSSLTYMAVPAKAYASDWSFFLANVPILLLAPLIARVHVPFFRSLGETSAYAYLERRFSRSLRLFGSASFIALQAGKTAIVLYLPALALSAVSDFDLRLGVIALGTLSFLMTFRGGVNSAIWTDVAQTVILLAGAGAALAVALAQVPSGVALEGKFFDSLSWSGDLTLATGWVILIGNLFSNLVTYTASQDVVQRYLTAVDDRRAARSVWTNALLALPSTALFFAVGTALYAFYKARPEALDPTLPTDAVFAQFMVRQLPPGLGGLVVAGLFAAAQPTAGLNSMATAWAVDFAQRKGVAVSLRTGRRATAVAALLCTGLALAMTWMDVASAWDAFLSWLGLAGGLLAGLFALGMLDRRANARGAWVGVAAGVVALYVARAHLGWHFFTYAAVGVVACFGAGALASRIFRSA